MAKKSSPAVCLRCGRSPQEAPGEWNVVYRRGVRVGLLCPEDQTAEENAEAVITEATTDYTKHRYVRPGNPEYNRAAAEAMAATVEDVWREYLELIVATGEAAELDPFALADRAMERWPGRPRSEEKRLEYREEIAQDYATRLRIE